MTEVNYDPETGKPLHEPESLERKMGCLPMILLYIGITFAFVFYFS